MSDYPQFLKIRFKIWWIIFIFIQLFIVLLMSASFWAESWVKTENDATIENLAWNDTDNNIYKGDSFVGNLFACEESCDESFDTLATEWCDYYTDLDDNNITEELTDPYHSVCLMYLNLSQGVLIIILFEIAAIISICVWAASLVCYMNKTNCICLSYCCSGTTWVLHYIAFIGYMFQTRTNFNGDCEDFPENGENPKLCAGDGPGIMLFLAIIIPIFCIFFCIVACDLQKKYGIAGFDKKQDQELAAVQANLPSGANGIQLGGYPQIMNQNYPNSYPNAPMFILAPVNVMNPTYSMGPGYAMVPNYNLAPDPHQNPSYIPGA